MSVGLMRPHSLYSLYRGARAIRQMTITPKVVYKIFFKNLKKHTDQHYCFFCHQDPQAEHQKTWTLVTSSSSALPSGSEQFSIYDKKKKRQGRLANRKSCFSFAQTIVF